MASANFISKFDEPALKKNNTVDGIIERTAGWRTSRDAERSHSLSYGGLVETFEMLIVAKNWSKIHPTIHISQHKVRLRKFLNDVIQNKTFFAK